MKMGELPYDTTAVGFRKEDYQPGAASKELDTPGDSGDILQHVPALAGLDAFLSEPLPDEQAMPSGRGMPPSRGESLRASPVPPMESTGKQTSMNPLFGGGS